MTRRPSHVAEEPPAEAGRHAVERRVSSVFGLRIDALTMDETVARIGELIAEGGIHQHVAVNVDKVVKAHRDPGLRTIINGCDIISADGQPVVWASRWLGQPLPERVTGIDLMERLIGDSASTGRRLYFLGASEEVVRDVVARVRRDHPHAVVAGWRNGYWAPDEEQAVALAVAAATPDILFLAIPSPAKERFLDRWKETMGARFVMGVGGSFDVYAGAVTRAPGVARALGLEWLHRLVKEPRRMWRRYLVDDLPFLPIVAAEWLRLRRRTRPVLNAAEAKGIARPLRILVVSNLYPSDANPSFGTFIASRVEALREAGAVVDVVAIRDASIHRRRLRKYLALLASALRIGAARAARQQRYDVIESHIAFPTGWIALPVALLHAAPLVLFVHGADVNDIARRSRVHRALARLLFRLAARTVVNSRYMARTLAALFATPDRVVVDSPGIDARRFAGENARDDGRSRSGVLFVGRLHPQKGINELLAAMSDLADRGRPLQLTVIGTGPELERLRAVEATGTLPVRVLGPLPPAEVAAAMRRAAVLAVPSAQPEGLGLVALEGLAAGTIVVASRAGGLEETVIDGSTGVQCAPGDSTDLADAIARAMAIADDPERRRVIVEQGMQMALDHDVHAVARRSLEAYSVLARARR